MAISFCGFIRWLSALTLLATLVSCGGGSGSESSDEISQGTGTVGLFLTDMPADPALFESINASVQKVELMGSDENGRVTLYSGAVKTFDLLRLRNESIPLTFKDGVPADRYCKIRLTLSDLELVMADDTPGDPNDNETHHPKLPGNGKLDLVARDCFDVVDGGMVTLQVDIDAGKSIHVVGNNKAYHFRPVIFVEVINKAFDSKLVRLDGEIASIDTVAQTLTICDAIPAEGMDNLGCVKVHFGADAAFFDNLEYAGAPRSIDELLSAEKLGLELTVVGWLKFPARQHSDADRASREYPLIELEALVAELGEFLQVEGSVAVDADSTGFAMQVSSGGPIITADNLSIMFQQGSAGVNGSRIISRSGDLLDTNDVTEPLPVQVDGTLQLIQGSDPLLMAALVIIDKDAAHTEQVTGIILSVAVDGLTLNPDAPSVCGIATDSLSVVLSDSLDIWTVTITNSGSEIQPDGTLATGQTVGMTGNCKSGGYQTDNIVIVDDQRV